MWAAVIVAGVVVLALAIVAARRPVIGPLELRVFRAVNGLPDPLYRVLWLPMQLGNLVVGMVVGVGIALLYRDWWAAAGVVLAVVLKIVTERVIRREMAAHLAVRRRPGTSVPGAILRGDVPVDGPSFPSGHVLLVVAGTCVVATLLPPVLVVVACVLALGVIVGHVYVGAHTPLDVVAGTGAGAIVGGVVALLLTL